MRVVLCLIALLLSGVASATDRSVLIVHSYHLGFFWTDAFQHGVDDVLTPHADIKTRAVYLDTKRLQSALYFDQIYQLYKTLLEQERYDAVLVSDNNALSLMQRLAPQLGDTPVIFGGINNYSREMHRDLRATGVTEDIDIESNIALIRRLQPNVERIYVVTDFSRTGAAVRQQLNHFIARSPQYQSLIQPLVPDTFEHLYQRAAGMNRNDAILYWVYYRDQQGEVSDLVQWNTFIHHAQAPVYVVHFSQRAATEQAQALLSVDLCRPDEKQALKDAVRQFRFDSPFGKTLRRMVLHGVGLHHAGLLPRYRLLIEKLAQQGLFRAICGTDTLGVGINVPIRTVLFTQLCKFDGAGVDLLTVRDFHQIAGRAGRKGFDDEGLVVAQAPDWVIDNERLEAKIAAGKKRSKVKKKSAPTRGYKHWDEATYERMQRSPPETLEPRFTVDHSLMVGLLQKAAETGDDVLEELDGLIARSHASARDKESLAEEGRQRLEALYAAGVVSDGPDGRPVLDEELQSDFSLHHGLSLFLLHALELLDRDAPDYALDVLTLVESILEHPKPVLYAQVSREKGELVAQLKADGMDYEDRMEVLDKVTWPKPRAEWIYATFNEWKDGRPWIPEDPIRPKSVARELVERQEVFGSYVRGLRLERVEGVLLRYLSQVYRTLLQNVPLDAATDDVEDVLAFLRAMLARVDDSLLTEWETLLDGADAQQPEQLTAKPVDISANPHSFKARIRAELHGIVRALARDDLDEAAASVCHDDEAWTADDFRTALDRFLDDQGQLHWDGRAKLGNLTQIQPLEPHRWAVRQVLVGDDDEAAWALEGEVDLRGDTNPSGPIVRIRDLAE